MKTAVEICNCRLYYIRNKFTSLIQTTSTIPIKETGSNSTTITRNNKVWKTRSNVLFQYLYQKIDPLELNQTQ